MLWEALPLCYRGVCGSVRSEVIHIWWNLRPGVHWRADLPWLSGAMSPDHAAVNPKGLPGLAAFRPPRGLGVWYTAPPCESCSRSPYVTGT